MVSGGESESDEEISTNGIQETSEKEGIVKISNSS